MTTIKLKHVARIVDRYGTARYYFRLPAKYRMKLADAKPGDDDRVKAVKLDGKPGTPEFMASYQAALDGVPGLVKRGIGETRGGDARTFTALAKLYYDTDFKSGCKAESSKRLVRGIIDRFLVEHGNRSVTGLTKTDAKYIIADKAETPGAANDLLKRLKVLVNCAVGNDWRADNPFEWVNEFELGTFHTWTEIEIEQFENRFPLGTRERTAFAMFLYTGQRVSDVVKMRWSEYNEANQTITVQQQKTRQAKADVTMTIACHPDLVAALAAWKAAGRAANRVASITGEIINSQWGKPYTAKSFSGWMADLFDLAGIADRCVAHGLRKAAARRLAEAGCSAHEIMAITGHKTLAEVQRYCDAANQARLSKAAVARMRESYREVG